MIVAIDYDLTYTRDPHTFDAIIGLLKAAGHTVICATYRSESSLQVVHNSIGKLCPVISAGTEWKREKAGYKVDIWIDDMPSSIERQMLVGV